MRRLPISELLCWPPVSDLIVQPLAAAIDNTSTGSASTTNTATVNLTTSTANDIILFMTFCEVTSGSAPAINTVTGGSLTFTRRIRSNGSARGSLEIWSAVAPSALSNVAFTGSFAATFDDLSVMLVGIKGLATTSPWDTNAGLPATRFTTTTPWTPSFTGISTSGAPGLELFATGNDANNSGAGNVPPSGFTSLGQSVNLGGSRVSWLCAGYKVTASNDAAATYTWGASLTIGATGEAVFDALTTVASGGGATQARVLVMA